MQDQDKILYFLKVVGPTIPAKVAKNINTEIMLASAHLSDLAAQGRVKISNLKIGGTPLYYLPGQEEQLYHFAAGNLNPKDYQVLEILKKQKILRENVLDLLSKVALRSLKDFAVPLHVTISGNKELFWKWHLLSDEEASAEIKRMLFIKTEEVPSEIPADSPAAAQTTSQSASVQEEQPKEQHLAGVPAQDLPASSQSESEKAPALAWEQEEPFDETSQQESNQQKSDQQEPNMQKSNRPEPDEELPEKIEKVLSEKFKSKSSAKTKRLSRKTKLLSSLHQEIFDDFLSSAEYFLADKEIIIREKEIVRKNAEINLVIKVPSAVGTVIYFCKAKKKAKCDEGDVSAAYMEAQIKKLPLLFMYTHELTKKAQEMLAADAFQNALVTKLERKLERGASENSILKKEP